MPGKNRKRHAPPEITSNTLEPWLPLVLVVLAAAVYGGTLGGKFVFDDLPNITDNSRVQALWPPDRLIGGTVRPLLYVSLALNYAAGEFNAWGYKLVNVLIHLAASLALFGLVKRTLRLPRFQDQFRDAAPGLALAVAALWLVHPLTTECVTYVIHRSESMMGLFMLLALYCLLRGAVSPHGWPWYVAAVVADWLGAGSKEIMIVAPAVMLCFDRLLLADSWPALLKRRWVVYLALLPPVLWLGYVGTSDVRNRLLTAEAPRAAASSPAAAPKVLAPGGSPQANKSPDALGAPSEPVAARRTATPWQYFRTQPEVILHYLRLAVWPYPLCVDYAWPVADTADRIVPGAVIVGGLLLLTLWGLWRGRPLAFLGAAFFLILAPTSSFLPIEDLATERRMYLPLAAVITLLVLGAWWLLDRLFSSATAQSGRGAASFSATSRRRDLAGVILLAVAVAVLSGLTYLRADDYRNGVALWESVVRSRPNNSRAYVNLAGSLMKDTSLAPEARTARAMQQLEMAAAIAPNSPFVQGEIGHVLAENKLWIQAAEHFRRALALDPNHPRFHVNLAAVLEKVGKSDEALEHYRLAVKLGRETDRDMAETHFSLAQALTLNNRNKFDEALSEYREALRINPQYLAAEVNMGQIYAVRGELEQAIVHFRRALELERRAGTGPTAVRAFEVYENLAMAYGELHRYDEGLAVANEGLRLAQATGQAQAAAELREIIANLRRNQAGPH